MPAGRQLRWLPNVLLCLRSLRPAAISRGPPLSRPEQHTKSYVPTRGHSPKPDDVSRYPTSAQIQYRLLAGKRRLTCPVQKNSLKYSAEWRGRDVSLWNLGKGLICIGTFLVKSRMYIYLASQHPLSHFAYWRNASSPASRGAKDREPRGFPPLFTGDRAAGAGGLARQRKDGGGGGVAILR